MNAIRVKLAFGVFLIATLVALGQETGNSSRVLHPITAGEAEYFGVQIKYLICRTHSPSGKDPKEGNFIGYVPPVSFVRTKTGEIDIRIASAKHRGPFTLPMEDGKARPVTARELAEAVWADKVSPDEPVLVTFPIELACEDALKSIVLRKARSLLTDAFQSSPAHTSELTSGDIQRMHDNVIMLPSSFARVVCKSEGMEDVIFPIGQNPTLGRRMTIHGKVTAAFLSQLFHVEGGGVTLALELETKVFGESITTLNAKQTVDDFVKTFVKADGLGEFKANGKEVKILVTRDQLNNSERKSRWTKNVVVRGGSIHEINLVLGLYQREADLSVVSEDQVSDWIKEITKEGSALKDPSVANAMQEVINTEKLKETDDEKLLSTLDTFNKHFSRASGGSFLGLISSGGASSSQDAGAKARREQERKFARDFVRNLQQYSAGGQFKVPPSVKLNLLSSNRLQREAETVINVGVAGNVSTMVLPSFFSSAFDWRSNDGENGQRELNRKLADFYAEQKRQTGKK